MRSFRLLVLVFSLVIAFTFLLSSCKKKPAEDNTGTVSTTAMATVPPAVDFDLNTLVTLEEAQDALGIKLNGPKVEDSQGSVTFLSDDQKVYIEIKAAKMTSAEFEAALAQNTEYTEAPNLGEKAVWYEAFSQLLIFKNDRSISIYIEYGGVEKDDILIMSRQIALKAVERF